MSAGDFVPTKRKKSEWRLFLEVWTIGLSELFFED